MKEKKATSYKILLKIIRMKKKKNQRKWIFNKLHFFFLLYSCTFLTTKHNTQQARNKTQITHLHSYQNYTQIQQEASVL